MVAGDVLSLGNGLSGAFSDKNAGTGKTVSSSGLSLSGTDAGNYTLADTTAAALADIARQSDYPDDPNRVDLFYAASYALIDFLLERGSIEDLVRLAGSAKGSLFDRLHETYGSKVGGDEAELQERWAGHVRQMRP